jgi:hypothetical protein
MKFYSLMPFDAFNGSLVEYCPVHVAGFKLVTHSRIQGKRKEKLPRRCELVVTGLTSDMHRSDRCKPRKSTLVGDPAPMTGWPRTPLYAAGWPDSYGRVTRGWSNFSWKWWFGVKGCERLNTFQLINHLCVVTKFGMNLTKVLNWTKCFVGENLKSLALFKGELITTLESPVGLTISSKWSCSLIPLCIPKEDLDKRNFQKNK